MVSFIQLKPKQNDYLDVFVTGDTNIEIATSLEAAGFPLTVCKV